MDQKKSLPETPQRGLPPSQKRSTETADPLATAGNREVAKKGTSLSQDAWRRLTKNKMAVTGLIVFAVYVLLAIGAPFLPIYSYKKIILDHANLPPSLFTKAGELSLKVQRERTEQIAARQGRSLNEKELASLEELKRTNETEMVTVRGKSQPIGQRRYLLGTDYAGRDLLSRILYGSRLSIGIGLVGALITASIGVFVGAFAGYKGGRTDYFITRLIDIMFSLPYLFVVIILMTLFGRNIINLFVAISLISWLTVARVVRGQIISLKNSEFIEAARSVGASPFRIIYKHLVPNTIGVIIVYTTLRVPAFILSESFLSFLGLGVSAPKASWGTLIRDALEGLELYPWRLFFPALTMTIFLFFVNFVGDGLRDAFDPQSKNRL